MAAHDRARRARVIEVDVREQQMAEILERDAVLASPASSAGRVEVGPQSKSASPSVVSTRYTPIACGAPPKFRSIKRQDLNESITASSQSGSYRSRGEVAD